MWEYNNVRSPHWSQTTLSAFSLGLCSNMYGGILITAEELWLLLWFHIMQLPAAIGGEMLNVYKTFKMTMRRGRLRNKERGFKDLSLFQSTFRVFFYRFAPLHILIFPSISFHMLPITLLSEFLFPPQPLPASRALCLPPSLPPSHRHSGSEGFRW